MGRHRAVITWDRHRIFKRGIKKKITSLRKNIIKLLPRNLLTQKYFKILQHSCSYIWFRHPHKLRRHQAELRNQLARLGSDIAPSKRERGSALKGRRVPIKYRDRSGNTWAGRGARPRRLVAAIKEGKRLEDFVVEKRTVAARKASPSKSKKRRAKR